MCKYRKQINMSNMGRPIQDDVFGDTAAPGFQFAITAKLPGVPVGEGFIVKQTGTSEYKVNIGGNIGDVDLVNTITPANLNDGEGFIAVTPFGGSTIAAFKVLQKRVSCWLTPDDPNSTFRGYVWSENPAAQTGQADVGVSTAGAASNQSDGLDDLIFTQTPSGDVQPYITTLRDMNWNTEPPVERTDTFTTSDNKLVIFHESAFTNGFVDGGAVTVVDGTTTPVPTVIGGSEITSTWESTNIDEGQTKIIQLTDTRYARLTSFDTATTTTKKRIEIVDVNLTTGAAAIDITHDLEQYRDVTTQNSATDNFIISKISSTRFAVYFVDVGVTTPATLFGGLYCMVFDDAGTSITVQMSKTLVVDMTNVANNEGDSAANVARMTGTYLGNTNRIGVATFETTRNAQDDMIVIAWKFNATFTGIDTIGALYEWVDNGSGGFFPYTVPLDPTHVLISDEDRAAAGSPIHVGIVDINPTTLAVTAGAKIYAGAFTTLSNITFDRDYDWYVDGTKVYLHSGYEDRDQEVTAGTLTINQQPFDGTADIDTADKVVATAGDLVANHAGSFTNTTVLAIDTGLVHYYDGASWQLATTNISRWDYRGQCVFEFDIDLGTNTITNVKQEMLMSNSFERFRSDGAGGVEWTGLHTGFDVSSAKINKLPNGSYILVCRTEAGPREDAPYFTKAAYDGRTTLRLGGEMKVQYFDPTLMP